MKLYFILWISLFIIVKITALNLSKLTKSKAHHTIITKPIIINENINLFKSPSAYILESRTSNEYILSLQPTKSSYNLAEISFINELFQFGWDKISVSTYKTPKSNSYSQSYFAGYWEGRMTQRQIHNFYSNWYNNNSQNRKDKSILDSILTFFNAVADSLIQQLKTKDVNDKLFLPFQQLIGMCHGYNYNINDASKRLTLGQFLLIQADGELQELYKVFKMKNKISKGRPSPILGNADYFKKAFGINAKKPQDIWNKMMSKSRCSAFIKIWYDEKSQTYKDLLSGHTTWSSYSEMLRAYKHYSFEFDNNALTIPSSTIIFSSYPGAISSTDDYYLTQNNLVITETTIEVVDIRLYEQVVSNYSVDNISKYIPNFMRVWYASKFSKSASDFPTLLKENSFGSYSSQWMIIDYNVFNQLKAGEKQVKNLLVLVEEIPTQVIHYDITHFLLKHTYFGSYNRAFWKKTKNNLNQQWIEHWYGNSFSYKMANRAIIFKEQHKSVKDIKSMMSILRYNKYRVKDNQWKGDPSTKHPSRSISARYDLENNYAFDLSGGIDSKVTNCQWMTKLGSVVIAGPTLGNKKQIVPFRWKDFPDQKDRHEGIPDEFNFGFVEMSPATIKEKSKSVKFKEMERDN